jgi:DNA-binding GntR family transcriptional regulator
MLEQTYDLDKFLAVHKKLMEAVLDRDFDKARARLTAHLRITMSKVYPEHATA